MHRTKPDGELVERACASVYGRRLGGSVLQISCGIMFVDWRHPAQQAALFAERGPSARLLGNDDGELTWKQSAET